MSVYLDDGDVVLHQGDALGQLALMPSESVHCIVTSPPFFGLRDYGMAGQIGLEESPSVWCDALVAVFREARRVLRSDGVMWLECGDSYNANTQGSEKPKALTKGGVDGSVPNSWGGGQATPMRRIEGVKPKDLVGAPWLLAFALRADGWYLRSDTIWSRPNPMPESVTDRPTKAHSYVFLLTKSARYFYDADAIREDEEGKPQRRLSSGVSPDRKAAGEEHFGNGKGSMDNTRRVYGAGRNARSVWSIPTEPTPFAHFATFPQALVERCIKAGTSERGACSECGAPWRRITERGHADIPGGSTENGHTAPKGHPGNRGASPPRYLTTVATTGWEPSCACQGLQGRMWAYAPPIPVVPCVVLDPFSGSGTTALVARRLGRHAIGIELNAEYLAISATRLQQLSLLA